MKLNFSDEWIARLNATSGGGVFAKAVILVVSPSETLYFADTQESIDFNGETYQPMPMTWEAVGQNSQLALPSIRVTVPNVTGVIGSYLEVTNLLGADVTLQLLHLELLGTVTDVDTVRLQLMLYEWNELAATFTLGLNLGLTESLPRHVMTRAEYGGIPDSFRRASIL